MDRFKVVFYLLGNLVFSISVIMLNKWIYTETHFPNVTLSLLHFVFTFLGLWVCERLNIFNTKSVQLNSIALLALSFCGFVVFTNLSLQFNTVGTFQVAKMLTTPGVIMIQILYYRKHFSLAVKSTLIPVIVGVIVSFCYDLSFNVAGAVYAVLGVMITSLYQVLVNAKQSELQLNSMQLLYYQAPLSAVFLFLCVPVFEPPLETLSHSWTGNDLILISASCLTAFFCNLTTYWIIGNTSPLTYNMLGHTKFVLITLSGWMLFDEVMTVNQWFGIGLTFSGIVAYSHVKMKEISSPKEKLPLNPIEDCES